MLSSTIASRAASAGRMKRFALACILCFVGVYFGAVIQILAERRANVHFYRNSTSSKLLSFEQAEPLPDLGFDVLPRIHRSSLTDFLVASLLFVTILRFFLIKSSILRILIFRRWLTLLGLVFFVCSIVSSLTLLPSPDKDCHFHYRSRIKLLGGGREMKNLTLSQVFLLALLSLVKRVNTCADMMFSGHIVNATLCGLMWSRYSHLRPVMLQEIGRNRGSGLHKSSSNTLLHLEVPSYIHDEALTNDNQKSRKLTAKCGNISFEIDSVFLKNAFVWMYIALVYMAIISTRFRYSSDVFVGFVLTLLMWKIYHYAAHIVQNTPREYKGYNLLSFVLYMEAFSEFDSDHVSENIETAAFRYDADKNTDVNFNEKTRFLATPEMGLFIKTRRSNLSDDSIHSGEREEGERERLPESPRSYGSSSNFPRVSSNPLIFRDKNYSSTYESFRNLS